MHTDLPVQQVTCPAFGGCDHDNLIATSATEGQTPPSAAEGQTFSTSLACNGRPEHRVII